MAGWVSDVTIHPVADSSEKMVFTGLVRHSQSVSASHLKPWVADEKCGTIAHAWRGLERLAHTLQPCFLP